VLEEPKPVLLKLGDQLPEGNARLGHRSPVAAVDPQDLVHLGEVHYQRSGCGRDGIAPLAEAGTGARRYDRDPAFQGSRAIPWASAVLLGNATRAVG